MRPADLKVLEIKCHIDELIRRLNRWLSEKSNPIMPESVSVAIERALLVCDLDEAPMTCQPMALAIGRLAEDYRGYREHELGKIRVESGAPGPSFWAAAKKLAIARHAAEMPQWDPLEPVSVLLQQGVTHDQIARHIYGRRDVGPFLEASGVPDVALIEQEAHEPGSVIPADWIPPWHQSALAAQRRKLAVQLAAFDRVETGRKYEDPATVEELLTEGAFVQQIERAKGVTREEVLEAARRIGVTAIDRPGYEPSSQSEDHDATGDPDDETPATEADRAALKELILEIYTTANGAKGSAEIAAELRQRGHVISTKAISALIGHHRKRVKSMESAV